MVLYSIEILLAGKSLDVSHPAHGAEFLRPVEFRENVPFVDHGKTQMLEELPHILAGRDRLSDARVRSRVGTEDKSILAR